MIDPPKIIGVRLKALRDTTRLKQTPFADDIGVTQSAWSQYESGKRQITLDVAVTLVERFGVTLDWIYFGDSSGLPIRLQKLSRL